MRFLFQIFTGMVIAIGGMTQAFGEKQAQELGPGEVIEAFAGKLLVLVREQNGEKAIEIDRYYAQVEALMEETIQFPYIAKGVMGKHANGASKDQKIAFLKVFRSSLAQTLAKAIANYSDAKVTIEEVITDSKNPRKAYVAQRIQHGQNVVRVVYTMGQWKKDGWRVSNITLDSTNLGETYKNQFDQAVAANKGDLSKVIDWWAANG